MKEIATGHPANKRQFQDPLQVTWPWNPRAQPLCESAIPRELTLCQGLEMP